jgi:hypothetical protein
LGIIGTVVSCQTERAPCLQPIEVNLRFGCYQRNDTTPTLSAVVLPNAILNPVDSPKTWMEYSKNVSALYLTLSPHADSCRWYLQPDSAIALRDTMVFYYQTQLHFISNACGYTFFYTLDSLHITRHFLDTAYININTVSDNANEEHVKLLFP